MDLAYDAITQSTYTSSTPVRSNTPTPPKPNATNTTTTLSEPTTDDPQATPRSSTQFQRTGLQAEFQETFKAFSASPWGAKLGGWWSSTTKQGQSYYEEAVREVEDLGVDALKGLSDLKQTLVTRTRGMSGGEGELLDTEKGSAEKGAVEVGKEAGGEGGEQVNATESFLEKFKAEAAKRLKEVQAAEDAADEALLRFGTNVRNFLRDAVVITEPDDELQGGEVLFESKDAAGKRVVHASRLEGQIYVLNTTRDKFTSDPEDGEKWEEWKKEFDVEARTEEIAKDLERYEELRAMMEATKEDVKYEEFWRRYYYWRGIVEGQEARRKELLKASANDTEEVAWDEDSDDEEKPMTPQINEPQTPRKPTGQHTNTSSTTVHQTDGLKPEGRRSHDEKSVADSEASYDIVSGAPSRAASSPKEKKVDESDEEDWE